MFIFLRKACPLIGISDTMLSHSVREWMWEGFSDVGQTWEKFWTECTIGLTSSQ